jgi:hypothetical protein
MNKQTALDYLADCKWVCPSNYVGKDWDNYFCLVSLNRDSDPIERVNFETARKILSKWEGEEVSETLPGDIPCPDMQVTVASANHWAVGWVETLLIHKDASEDALTEAAEIICSLADYPCLDDESLSNLEWEEANVTWDHMSERERVCLAKRIRIAHPGLAARWGFHIMIEKTEGNILEYLRHG